MTDNTEALPLLTEEHEAMNRAADRMAIALRLLESSATEAARLALRDAHNNLVGAHGISTPEEQR